MTKVRVDFNNLVRHGQVRASLRHVEGEISIGDVVEAYDPDEGLSYAASVADIDKARGRLYLEPHWEPRIEALAMPWALALGQPNQGPGGPLRVRYTPAVPVAGGTLVNH